MHIQPKSSFTGNLQDISNQPSVPNFWDEQKMCLCCRPPPAPALRAQEDRSGCTKQSTIQMRCLKQLAVSSGFLKHLPIAFFTARRTVKGLSSPNKCYHTKIKISLTASIHAPERTLRLVLSPLILTVPGNSYYSWTHPECTLQPTLAYGDLIFQPKYRDKAKSHDRTMLL